MSESQTTQLWFGTADVNDTATAGEIGTGQGDREGAGSAPGPGNYTLSIWADCDACGTVDVVVEMFLVDQVRVP